MTMTSSAAVSTTPEVLGNLMGDEMTSGGQLALTNGPNGSTTPTSSVTSRGTPSLSQLVGIMNAPTGVAAKAKGKAKAKATARGVRQETPKTPEELRQDYRKLAQTYNMDFPMLSTCIFFNMLESSYWVIHSISSGVH